MSTVIKVEGLSKLYRLGEVGTGSLAHDVNRWWHKVRGKEDPYLKVGQVNDRTRSAKPETGNLKAEKGSAESSILPAPSSILNPESSIPNPSPSSLKSPVSSLSSDYVFALRDVSFDVQQGEVLGIIGRNGAGKSTLLKILSRVTVQTTGRIRVKGRIASLLEVGTGFHPELTGRENVYLNGAILGMRKAEIKSKFDEIVDFSGCERYIDTPVKRYSSGMYVRLAFAVAAHLEPEILIVDEVLAVGDAEFQKKCLGKMKDVAGHGRTVLFVSHNMTAVKSLCSRTILMRNGLLAADGQTEAVISGYQNLEFKETLQRSWDAPTESESYLKHGVYLKEARVVFDRTTDDLLRVGTPFQLRFCVQSRMEDEVNLSPHYLGVAGEVIFAAPSPKYHLKPGDNWFTCHIPGQFFNDGLYTLMVMIVKDSGAIQTVDEALIFEVHEVERTGNWFGKWPGVVRPKFEWDFQQSEYNLLA